MFGEDCEQGWKRAERCERGGGGREAGERAIRLRC